MRVEIALALARNTRIRIERPCLETQMANENLWKSVDPHGFHRLIMPRVSLS